MLNSYVPFTYLFAVTVYYKTEEEADLYSPTVYNWRFHKYLRISDVVVNTTSPLLNYTFKDAGRYRYHLLVSNHVSTCHTEGGLTGYSCYI